MKKQIFLFLGILAFAFSSAQEKLKPFVLDKYPADQTFYKGGLSAFYKEVHDAVVQAKLTPCAQDEPNQYYKLKLKIYPDGRVEKLKNLDSLIGAKNDCARVLANRIVPKLKNWKPAIYHGKEVPAIAEIFIFPYDLFDNYKKGLNSVADFHEPEFPGGKAEMIHTFNTEFYTIFQDYDIKGGVLLNFDINEKGEMVNPTLWPKVMEQSFTWDMIRTFKRIKAVWKPALRNGVPMTYHFEYGMEMNVSYNYDNTNKDSQ